KTGKTMRENTMEFRRIRANEGVRLRALRLRALADSPTAFGSTLGREESYLDAIWHERAANGAAGAHIVTILAEHDNLLVGMATGLAADSGREHNLQPTMVGVFVDRTVRRQGVGSTLVERIVDWAKMQGAARLHVWITSSNDPALALYRRCGFCATG